MTFLLLALAVLVGVALWPRGRRAAWAVISWTLSVASGEFLLRRRANGGDVVFVRSIWTSVVLFALAIGLEECLATNATRQFNATALQSAVVKRLPWLGAIFAATYAAFYSRFASQWTYLAGLYNQIMASQIQTPRGNGSLEQERVYVTWWAAFIEDAEDVHLALKPNYAYVIAGQLGDPSVRKTYEDATVNGARRLARLESRLRANLGDKVFRHLKEAGQKRAAARSAKAPAPPSLGPGEPPAATPGT